MKIFPVVLAFVFIFTFHCNVAKGYENVIKTAATTADHEHYLAVAKEIRHMEKVLKNTVNSVFKTILPYAMELSEKINVSQECSKNSLHLLNGVRNIKKWAFQFLDASGKVPDGIMYGSLSAVGHYDQCLDIDVKSTRKTDLGKKFFQGQYCTILVTPSFSIQKPIAQKMHEIPEELIEISKSDSALSFLAQYINYMSIDGFRFGVCLPTGCTIEDINSALQIGIENLLDAPYVGRMIPNINASAASCVKKEENNYTPVVISVLVFYASICFLVLAGSIVDLYSTDIKAAKSNFTKALLAFSLITNFNKFCSPSQQSGKLACLNGMKFFELTWVVLGHTFIAGLFPFIHGLIPYMEHSKSFAFQAVVNAMFAVNTFFVIGSFLVTYITTKNIIMRKKKFSALMFIIHRLLRIYPAYIVLLSTVVLIPLINSGPFWTLAMEIFLDPCIKNWWANLLFINNFYQRTELCLLHTWYITVDIQLYILSLIFLIPLMKWPKIGLSLMFLGIIGHALFCGIMTYVNEWPPTVLYGLMTKEEILEFSGYMYFSPFTHLGPYGIGLMLGYICATIPDIKMSRLTQVLGWSISFLCSFSVLFGSLGWYVGPMPQYLSVIYASLSRIAWSIGPAWIIFCCYTGHGGIINWILSWRIFTHLGRLTFCAYLIHLVPLIIFFGGLKTRLQPDSYVFVWIYAGCLCVSYLLGFVLHMFIEVPFANLERVFLLDAGTKPESIEKENNILDKVSKEKMMGNIIILTPEKDSFTKL